MRPRTRKIIDKGIVAQGRKVGDKLRPAVWKAKGTFFGLGMELPYSGTWSVQYPDKSRMELELTAGGMTINLVEVTSGNKGWVSVNGMVMDLTEDQMTEHRESQHADLVTELLPLGDAAFKLTPAGESKVDGKPAVGVKVAYKGRRDVTLQFDKETGLLVGIDQTVKDEMSGQMVKQETVIKSYTKVGNEKVPGKIVVKRDGKDYLDGDTTEYKFVEKLPAATFEKP